MARIMVQALSAHVAAVFPPLCRLLSPPTFAACRIGQVWPSPLALLALARRCHECTDDVVVSVWRVTWQALAVACTIGGLVLAAATTVRFWPPLMAPRLPLCAETCCRLDARPPLLTTSGWLCVESLCVPCGWRSPVPWAFRRRPHLAPSRIPVAALSGPSTCGSACVLWSLVQISVGVALNVKVRICAFSLSLSFECSFLFLCSCGLGLMNEGSWPGPEVGG